MFMCVPYPSLCLFQREISNAADTAARLYREATPEALRSSTKIWDIMSKAQDRLIKSIRSRNFEKFISVAHKDNGDDFFNEVSLLSLWSHLLFHSHLQHVMLDISFLLFSILTSYLCGRLTVISPPSSSLIWPSKNFKRWLRHMWMPISRPSGFVGGIPLPMSRKIIDFHRISLLGRKSSKIGSTKLLSGRRCNSCFFPLSIIWNLHTKD